MLDELEELADIRAYDEAKASGETPVPLEEALAEIRREQNQKRSLFLPRANRELSKNKLSLLGSSERKTSRSERKSNGAGLQEAPRGEMVGESAWEIILSSAK